MTSLKNIRTKALLLATVSFVSLGGAGITQAQDAVAEVQDSTQVYDASFFEKYPSAQNAWDMVKRIPGAEQIAGGGGGGMRGGGGQQNKRGFSSNDDRVLINGKRLSGKENNSRDALQRITMERVARIEIIRGSSPDIKVSSQEALLNVVLKEGVSTGSGTWTVEGRALEDGRVRLGGALSYGDSIGPVDFFVSAEKKTRHLTFDQIETVYEGKDKLVQELREEIIRERFNKKLSTNLIFNLNNGDQLRLNGQYEDGSHEIDTPGMLYFPDADNVLQLGALGQRNEKNHEPQWEVGGDWETSLGDDYTFKILGLYTNRVRDKLIDEDTEIATIDPVVDFVYDKDETATEAISRASVTWNIPSGGSLEFGTEASQNKVTSNLVYQVNEDGVLVLEEVADAQKTIKEFRDESFVNFSYPLSDKLSLDTSGYFEYSKITQDGDAGRSNRHFTYFKPSADLRYVLNGNDQVQFSVRRKVEQLNFSDFASSVTGDDEVVLGNEGLVPEKKWELETAYEHQLDEGAGRIKLSLRHEQFSDKKTQIPFPTATDPLGTAVGNAGSAHYSVARLDTNLRMVWIDMPNLVFNGSFELRDSELKSPFTGEPISITYRDDYQIRLNIRHDIPEWGLSYGMRYDHDGPTDNHLIDETIRIPFDRTRLDLWTEYNIYADWIVRLHLENVLNGREGRYRDLYAAGVASGVLTGVEVQDKRGGLRLLFSLRGTF